MGSLNWYLKETVKTTGLYFYQNLNSLFSKYRTQVTACNQSVTKSIDENPNKTYVLEVWYNFESRSHIINIYEDYDREEV